MVDWMDEGVVLSVRPHGEAGAIALLLTREHGSHAGLVRGHRRLGPLQPGTRVQAHWRARLSDQLGTYMLDPLDCPAAGLLDDPLRLAALASACAVLEGALPERAAYPAIHDGLIALLDGLGGEYWGAVYVLWELELLAALGFGLDLQRCAVTGGNDRLAYVSPKSGRAVSLSAADGYEDRLLPLPGFLRGEGGAEPPEVLAGLTLSGHFVARWLFAQANKPPPAARERFVDRYRRLADTDAQG
ncbi:MAG: DNA repair protein RecO [Alphaproteobacteria bacterium]|jgi:DNA repair protein RecO (recombination protein O)|nr:DNA repair protein RecO [Alphaproteobacteria bacterium]